jgi:hypothetical protein
VVQFTEEPFIETLPDSIRNDDRFALHIDRNSLTFGQGRLKKRGDAIRVGPYPGRKGEG